MVEIDGIPILSHCFERLVDLDADELIVIGYLKERIIDHYGDEFQYVSITYSPPQREYNVLSHSKFPGQE